MSLDKWKCQCNQHLKQPIKLPSPQMFPRALLQSTSPLTLQFILPLLGRYINGIMQKTLFLCLFLSLNIMFLSSSHNVASISSPFLFMLSSSIPLYK